MPRLSNVIITLKGIDPGDEVTPTLGSFKMRIFNNSMKLHEFHVVDDISLSHDEGELLVPDTLSPNPISENPLEDPLLELPSHIPTTFDDENLLNENVSRNPTSDTAVNPYQNPIPGPSTVPDFPLTPEVEPELIDLGPLDLSPRSADLDLDLEGLNIPSPTDLIQRPSMNLNNDDYSKFLKTISNKESVFDTVLKEHNENLLKFPHKIILIPTSIDLDESNPYVSEILNDNPNRDEILNAEKEPNSFLNTKFADKEIYLMFTKVHHFDESSYPDIYDSLKRCTKQNAHGGWFIDLALTGRVRCTASDRSHRCVDSAQSVLDQERKKLLDM
ncbi:unnamed protein product [Arctia plantaginis]|uniref:Uncharacterized protein n=1 Tax=Arctia plantaginis TaxID=874455 RepID=A0A8S0Z236_ARCPL|nr:unnamed protein product [Arctia plantaginis]